MLSSGRKIGREYPCVTNNPSPVLLEPILYLGLPQTYLCALLLPHN